MLNNLNIRRLSTVRRWAIGGYMHPQSVAEHSYYVAVYCRVIGQEESLPASEMEDLLWLALMHDFPEYLMSDIPGPIKRTISSKTTVKAMEEQLFADNWVQNPELFVSNKMKRILKLANLLDEWWHLNLCRATGNTTLTKYIANVEERIELAVSEDFTSSVKSMVADMLGRRDFTFDGYTNNSDV